MSERPAEFNPNMGRGRRYTSMMRLLAAVLLLAAAATAADDPGYTATAQFDDV
jgi:hypothetical protein